MTERQMYEKERPDTDEDVGLRRAQSGLVYVTAHQHQPFALLQGHRVERRV